MAVNETAKKGVLTFQAIHQLRQDTAARLQSLGRRSANAALIVESLYTKPITTSGAPAYHLALSQATTDRLIADLRKLGILHEMTGQRRNRLYYFRDYYRLFAE